MPTLAQLNAMYPVPTYPFSTALLTAMAGDAAFFGALKLSNTVRFQVIPYILLSHTPAPHPRHQDEVIGIWYLDKTNATAGMPPLFKQDFIVNVGHANTQFVSYSASPTVVGPTVRPIADFFRDYGHGTRYYHRTPGHLQPWQHHYDKLVNLPRNTDLRAWARQLRDEFIATGICTI